LIWQFDLAKPIQFALAKTIRQFDLAKPIQCNLAKPIWQFILAIQFGKTNSI
jgi:hypothetical protein